MFVSEFQELLVQVVEHFGDTSWRSGMVVITDIASRSPLRLLSPMGVYRAGSKTVDAYSIVGRIKALYVRSFTGFVQPIKLFHRKPIVLFALLTMP